MQQDAGNDAEHRRHACRYDQEVVSTHYREVEQPHNNDAALCNGCDKRHGKAYLPGHEVCQGLDYHHCEVGACQNQKEESRVFKRHATNPFFHRPLRGASIMPPGKGASNGRYTGAMSEDDPTKKKEEKNNVVPADMLDARRKARRVRETLKNDPDAHLLSSTESQEAIDKETKALIEERNQECLEVANDILRDFRDVVVTERDADAVGMLLEPQVVYAVLWYKLDKAGFMATYSESQARALAERARMLLAPKP